VDVLYVRHTIMTPYLQSASVLVLLGLVVFAIFHTWSRYLIKLADKYDVALRRRRATLLFPLVAILLLAALMVALNICIRVIKLDPIAFAIGLYIAITPTFLWWIRRSKILQKHGYGRRSAE